MDARFWQGRHYTRRGFIRGVGVAAGSLALAPAIVACGNKSGGGASRAVSGASKPIRGGTLTVRMQSDVNGLDYATSMTIYSNFVIFQCVERLVTFDVKAQAQPSLAVRWETPDDQTYIFHLRQGVRFQDGTDLNADAVDYSIRHEFSGRPGTGLGGKNGLLIDTIEKPDAGTIRFTLTESLAPFLAILDGGAGSVISPMTAEKQGADKIQRDLTGLPSGPFKFGAWQKDDQITLTRNETYWGTEAAGGALPRADKLIIRVIPDPSQALASLRSGEIDAFRPGEGPAAKDLAAIRGDKALSVNAIPGPGYSYIAFNEAREPFNSRELRQAVSYALDRQALVESGWGPGIDPLDVLFSPSQWAHDPDYHPYLKRDLGRAKQLLAQAGKPNGFAFTVLTPLAPAALELAQAQLREVGINMSISHTDVPTYVATMGRGEHQAGAFGFTGTIDPSSIVHPFFLSNGSNNRWTGYQNPDVDALLNQAQTTLDRERRKVLYQQAQRLIMADAAFCITAPQVLYSLTSSKVHDFPTFIGSPVTLAAVWKGA